MAVGIVQGVQNLIDFADYNAAASASQYYANSASAYNAMLENAYNSGSSALVRGVIDGGGGKTYGKIIEFQPNLSGGTQAGVDVATVTEVGGEVEVASGAAALTALPLTEILAGIFAGLGVGILSYEANKDFWIDVSNNCFLNVPGYEPITYDNIEDMSLLTLFKDGKSYVDAELIQNINNYLIEIGAFDSTYESTYNIYQTSGRYVLTSLDCTFDNIKGLVMQCYDALLNKPWYSVALLTQIWDALRQYPTSISEGTCFTISMSINSRGTQYENMLCDIAIWTTNLSVAQNCTSYYDEGYVSVSSYNFSNYERKLGIRARAGIDGDNSWRTGAYNVDPYIGVYSPNGLNTDIYTSSLNNTVVIEPKIEEMPALEPRTISTTPNSIPTEMPDWWQHILEIGSIDPNTKELINPQFLPVSIPNSSPLTNPVTTPQADIQTGTVPATNPVPVGNSVLPIMSPTGSPFSVPSDPTPTPTPTPSIPVIPAIGGQANKLFTVYNPSQANLDALGSTLWTENIITQIVQMFTNNPMDAIISLHILYATPTTGANKEIKLGYVPTGVSCPEVTNQYVNVNCGTVRVPELFGDARDYANTDISIYLPMIGFRQLKTEDAMASNISVDYRVDVFTGTVLATVTISKAGVNQVFYTYEGNCAVNLPLTGADKSRQVATAVGAIGAMVTGSPLMALGSATAIAGGSARAQIQRSGNFTGNAGAMGCKKPYIIVSSDVAYDAVGYNAQYGYPANLTVMLGTCHGYVKVKEVHADTISNATEQEKRDIENQLKQGIIIH